MNFPLVAKETFDRLKGQIKYSRITDSIILHLKTMESPLLRARFVHDAVDDCARDVFAHPTVQEFLPCKAGCADCCHTPVGITEDEAKLFVSLINSGLTIDQTQLDRQVIAGDRPEDYYKLTFNERRCIFLGDNNCCRVYADRPSVCRTNAVLGEAAQCAEGSTLPMRLVKTELADMAMMGSFIVSKMSGALPSMVKKLLN